MSAASLAAAGLAPAVATDPLDVPRSKAERTGSTKRRRRSAVSRRSQLPPPIAAPGTPLVDRNVSERDAGESLAQLHCGTAGDHPCVRQLLTAVFHGPTPERFAATLEDPFYEPSHRWLVRRGGQLVSHIHLTQRVMRHGRLDLPVAGIQRLGTLPELRGRGYARQLLARAEQAMAEEHAVLGMLTTRDPLFFRRAGWSVCFRHSHAQASTHQLLVQLGELPHAQGSINVRPWRQIELPALVKLYEQHILQGAYGPLERSEAYWRWLTGHKPVDQIYVALEGPDRFDLDGLTPPIVGYAMVKDDRVVELVTSPGHSEARQHLLARACGDAVERDLRHLCLHAAPDEPLFDLFRAAGGSVLNSEASQGEVFMVKLLDPIGLLRDMAPELHLRAEEAQLARPCQLGLHLDGRKMRLAVSRRSVKLLRDNPGRSYLKMNLPDFTRLLLGHLNLPEAIEAGRVTCSTRLALDVAEAIFPRRPLWRPPVDDLML